MKSSAPLKLIFGIFLLTGNVTVVYAAGAEPNFSYFSDPALNFWGQTPPKKESLQTKGVRFAAPPKAATQSGAGAFPWQKYLDPKNDEFFREGDYTPPAPFMEIARDPSDSNIENWFRYLEQKNLLLHRLQDRLTAYATSHPQNLPGVPAEMSKAVRQDASAIERVSARIERAPAPRPDAKRFRLRLYFDSHCPHCEHMLSTTIRELSSMGYWIELKQVDRDESARARIPFPISPAMPDELKRYGIESVPVLLVGDIKAKSFFKMQGYQNYQAVLSALSTQRAR